MRQRGVMHDDGDDNDGNDDDDDDAMNVARNLR